MKILQINCVYGVGSTGKLVRDIHLSLQEEGYQSVVVYPKNIPHTLDRGVYRVSNRLLSFFSAFLRRVTGMQFDWAMLQTNRILRLLRKVRPDVVHLHCINGNDINVYRVMKYLASNKIKTLLTLHAEFPYTGGCGHAFDCVRWKTGCGHCPILREGTQSFFIDGTHRTWRKQRECYDRFDADNLLITAVSPWLQKRALQSPLLDKFEIVSVLNGVDTNVFNKHVTKEWREKLGLNDNYKILLYVTASFYPRKTDLKGGRFIMELAERLRGTSIRIVIAANYGDCADLPENIIYVGRTSTQEDLAALYSESDLSIITSSRETFSMPVAESLCCGTPIVGFRAGGPESIALPMYSEFVEYGDIYALEKCVRVWIDKVYDSEKIAVEAQSVYSKKTMTENYIKLYRRLNSCI